MKPYKQIKAKDAAKSVWNSLEITKIIVSAMTPLVVLGIGAYLSAQSAEQARKNARDDRYNARFSAIVDKRAQAWEKMGPLVIKIQRYNYQLGIGIDNDDINEEDIPKARAIIADLETLARTYNPYFSMKFADSVSRFIKHATGIYNETGARLSERTRHAPPSVSDEMFDKQVEVIEDDAQDVRRQLSIELGVSEHDTLPPQKDGQQPSD